MGDAAGMNTLSSELREMLLAGGAAKVGFAHLGGLSDNIRASLDFAVSIAVALDPSIIARIDKGPTLEYFGEYKRANRLLSELGDKARRLLEDRGHTTVVFDPTTETFNQETLRTDLPHKTVATMSGMGWIGKCALLVTREYGAAVRFSSVLTSAELDTGTPVGESRCGACRVCVDACPASAPSGRDWRAGMTREVFFNAHACRDQAASFRLSLGIDSTICGICVSTCVWTRKYINRSSAD